MRLVPKPQMASSVLHLSEQDNLLMVTSATSWQTRLGLADTFAQAKDPEPEDEEPADGPAPDTQHQLLVLIGHL
jgi:hypothetical protein